MTMPRKTPVPGRPRKSPLRVAARSPRFADAGQPIAAGQPAAEMSGEQLRAMMIIEYCQWLRTRTNKEKRPFQEETITADKVAARAAFRAGDACGDLRTGGRLPYDRPGGEARSGRP
jgi:hypothetical protein